MLFDILYTGLRDNLVALSVACVARLQVIVVGLEPKVRHMVGIRKDHLHLAATLVNRLLFRRYREPVEILGSRTCAITLHGHLIAMLMQEVHESLINLQGGLTTRQDNKRFEA